MFILRVRDICNWAGLFTLIRLCIAVSYPFLARNWKLAIFFLLFGAISDIVDGVLARKLNVVSHTGGFIDGWVDKIFNINVAWTLVLLGYVPWWMAYLLFSREWIQIPLVPYYVTRYTRGYIPPNRPFWAGKIASVSLVTCLVAGILELHVIMMASCFITAVLGLWSALIYFYREFELFK